jgi:hypothetical protein
MPNCLCVRVCGVVCVGPSDKYKSLVLHRLEIPTWCWSIVVVFCLIKVG